MTNAETKTMHHIIPQNHNFNDEAFKEIVSKTYSEDAAITEATGLAKQYPEVDFIVVKRDVLISNKISIQIYQVKYKPILLHIKANVHTNIGTKDKPKLKFTGEKIFTLNANERDFKNADNIIYTENTFNEMLKRLSNVFVRYDYMGYVIYTPAEKLDTKSYKELRKKELEKNKIYQDISNL